jgi:sugar phosphate isomerase/epimerase
VSATLGQLGLEWQTVFGLAPVDYVNLAADLGCGFVAITLVPGPDNPYGFEPWSLRDDVALRREMVAAMKDRAVSISIAEGFTVRPGCDISAVEPDLDVLAELQVPRINTVSMDPDLERSIDEWSLLADLAAHRGMQTTVEFAPSLTLTSLDEALYAIRRIGRSDVGLLVDTMHLVRSGGTPDDLAALRPGIIGHVQLSDHTMKQCHATYREDTANRVVPGEGELPLREILAVLPSDIVVGLEVPMRSRAEAGEPVEEVVRDCVRGAKELFGTLG